jgi:glycerol-3-phosphate O-acyltransferase
MARNYILEAFSSFPAGKQAMEKLMALYPDTEEVSPDTVYKEGSREARNYCNTALEPMILPGSRILNAENLEKLYNLSQAGHSCLLLVEHYGNSDLPNICYLTDKEKRLGEKFADHLVAIAGAKLSIENAFIAAYSRAYNRIVIYPSRSLGATLSEEERKKMMAVNMAAMKELTVRKYHKQMFLAFPSGTRIRPWDDETKKGVKEMASYTRAFEYLCFASINGNNLPIDKNDANMLNDKPQPDIIMLNVSKPVSSKEFLEETHKSYTEGSDNKAHIVGCIMQKLLNLHQEAEPARLKLLAELRKSSKR